MLCCGDTTHLNNQELERYTVDAAHVVLVVENVDKLAFVGVNFLFRNPLCVDCRVFIQIDDGVFAKRLAIEAV